MTLITLVSWEKHPQVIRRRMLYCYLFYAFLSGALIAIYLLNFFFIYIILIAIILIFLFIGYKFAKVISQQHRKLYTFKKNSIECVGRSYKPMPITLNFFFNRELNINDTEDNWDQKYPIQGKITKKLTKNESFIPFWIFPFNLGKQQKLFTISIIDTSKQMPTEVILENIRKEDWEKNEELITQLLEN